MLRQATARQLERLREFGINIETELSMEEAAEMIRDELASQGIKGPPRLAPAGVAAVMVCEGEGDPHGGRQWER